MRRYYVWRLTDDGKEFTSIVSELVVAQRLRQGWGLPGMDIRNGEEAMFQVWPYLWGDREECHKRYEILKLMLDVQKGDIILIPKLDLSSFAPSDSSFTIAVCKEGYNFYPLHLAQRDDYGHYIVLEENSASYYYKQSKVTKTIENKMKNITYSKAINRIVNDKELIKILENFAGN